MQIKCYSTTGASNTHYDVGIVGLHTTIPSLGTKPKLAFVFTPWNESTLKLQTQYFSPDSWWNGNVVLRKSAFISMYQL